MCVKLIENFGLPLYRLLKVDVKLTRTAIDGPRDKVVSLTNFLTATIDEYVNL